MPHTSYHGIEEQIIQIDMHIQRWHIIINSWMRMAIYTWHEVYDAWYDIIYVEMNQKETQLLCIKITSSSSMIDLVSQIGCLHWKHLWMTRLPRVSSIKIDLIHRNIMKLRILVLICKALKLKESRGNELKNRIVLQYHSRILGIGLGPLGQPHSILTPFSLFWLCLLNDLPSSPFLKMRYDKVL